MLAAQQTAFDNVALVVLVLLILLPILLVAFGILGTFNHSYWTLAYLRLSTPAGGAAPQPGQGA